MQWYRLTNGFDLPILYLPLAREKDIPAKVYSVYILPLCNYELNYLDSTFECSKRCHTGPREGSYYSLLTNKSCFFYQTNAASLQNHLPFHTRRLSIHNTTRNKGMTIEVLMMASTECNLFTLPSYPSPYRPFICLDRWGHVRIFSSPAGANCRLSNKSPSAISVVICYCLLFIFAFVSFWVILVISTESSRNI